MKRSIWTSIVIVTTLFFSAVLTVPAYADDSTLPPTDPAAEVVTTTPDSLPSTDSAPADAPVVDAVPADSAPADAPVVDAAPADSAPADAPVVDAAPADSAPADSPAVDAAPATDATTLSGVLDKLPEGTTVVVTNVTTGEVLPLATEAAAQAVVEGDPIWCPAGVAPNPNVGGCSDSFTNFTNSGLVAWITANPAKVSQAGTIWIAWNYSSAGELPNTAIDLNATTAGGTMENFALTIQGGWNGTAGSTGLYAADPYYAPYSTLTNPLWITGWKGAVTINNINIDGASYTSAADYSALNVVTTGSIALSQVNVTKSVNSGTGTAPACAVAADCALNGATLYNVTNGSGAGTVTITNSTFDENDGYGLKVNTDNNVYTTNLVANGNDGTGADINNASATYDTYIYMSGFKEFNDNGGNGLYIQTKGYLSINDVVANYNGLNGFVADNRTSYYSQGMTIGGTNYFMGNGQSASSGDGLRISSKGEIKLYNINASGNDGYGANVDNCLLSLSACTAYNHVYLYGVSVFDGNTGGDGLYIVSSGQIYVASNLSANYNTQNGVFLDNSRSPYKQAVFAVGANNYFTYNGSANYAGLKILSDGYIQTNNITTLDNYGYGAYLDNCGATTVCDTGISGSGIYVGGVNTFSYNDQDGLLASSFGYIIMYYPTAEYNGQYGVNANNATCIASPACTGTSPYSTNYIAVYGNGIFNSNGRLSASQATGLYAISHGDMYLYSLTANSNMGDGAYLQSDKTTSYLYPSIYLYGYNVFNSNYRNGLGVAADGSISIYNLTANSNGRNPNTGNFVTGGTGVGVSLKSLTPVYYMPTYLIGYVNVDDNQAQGLLVDRWGPVIIYNLTSTQNGLDAVAHGVEINNAKNVAAPQYVALYGNNTFSNSGKDGLNVKSYGVVYLYYSIANNNGERGVFINNYDPGTAATSAQGVYLYGSASFDKNLKQGLYISTFGQVVTYNLTSTNNGLNGTHGVEILNNKNPVNLQVVYLYGNNVFSNSGLDGLHIETFGVVVTYNVTAAKNGAAGMSVDNATNAIYDLPVYLVGYINANNNTDQGVYVKSRGVVITYYLTVNRNGLTTGKNGVEILNNIPASPTAAALNQYVALYGSNVISNNGGAGLYIKSYGAVSLYSLNSDKNGGVGVYVDNFPTGSLNTSTSAVYAYYYLNTNGNANQGVYINSRGLVLLYNVTAISNGLSTASHGVEINNAQTGSASNAGWNQYVYLAGTNTFAKNGMDGLHINSLGYIYLYSYINSYMNGGVGVYVDNQTNTTTATPAHIEGANINVNGNGKQGLLINAHGQVQLTNVYADSNGNTGTKYDGVEINNAYTRTTYIYDVYLNGSNTFTRNGQDGLSVFSYGNIITYNINASQNGWDNSTTPNGGGGAYLDNCKTNTSGCKNGAASSARIIYILGVNTFFKNGGDGLVVRASGELYIPQVSSDYNTGTGIKADSGGPMTLKYVHTYRNGVGYALTASSSIVVNGRYSYRNATSGTFSPSATITNGLSRP
jgi:hypothetical protein